MAKGRPILIGTESVEVSEKLSRILKQNKLEHTVLNAKNHAHEAEIIADAAKKEPLPLPPTWQAAEPILNLKEGVRELGGLHVIGTTRHQSRRIDRQLRGRSAATEIPAHLNSSSRFEDSLHAPFCIAPHDSVSYSASVHQKESRFPQKCSINRLKQRKNGSSSAITPCANTRLNMTM